MSLDTKPGHQCIVFGGGEVWSWMGLGIGGWGKGNEEGDTQQEEGKREDNGSGVVVGKKAHG